MRNQIDFERFSIDRGLDTAKESQRWGLSGIRHVSRF